MLGAKIISNHLVKSDKKADFLHSSGYAKVQNSQGFGAVSADDFATRKTLDSQRKYVQKYKNSRIMRSCYGAQRARTVGAQAGRNTSTERGVSGRTKSAINSVDKTGIISGKVPIASGAGKFNTKPTVSWKTPKFG